MSIRAALTEGVRRSDVVLVVALLTVNLVQVLWILPIGMARVPDSQWLGPVYAVGSTVPLLWRRTHPVTAACVGSAAWWLPADDAYLLLGYVLAILLFFSLGRWSSGWAGGLIACAWALAAGTTGTLLGTAEAAVPGVFGVWLVVVAPYLIGRLMAAQQREAEQRLLAERDATRRQAVEEERARIVRELHDVVGHEVTLMSIQSEAATQALAVSPDRAAEPVAAFRETAHRANRELRAILDLLGDDELAVTPDGRGLTELVARAARLGIPNTLSVTGEPWHDTPRHWLAVNRVVQECLTNAGKHAPGRAVEVEVAWSDDCVCLRASNPAPVPAPDAGTGLGVPGMEERVRLLGGTLRVEYEDGEFVVTAALPRPEEPS